MKFKIEKRYLLQSIQKVTNAISSQTVIPILAGLKLEATQSKIILTGSNSDITIQSHIPNSIEDSEIFTCSMEGSIILPVPHFPDIIKKLPENIVEINVEENYKTVIKSGNALFNLYGQSSDEYPVININVEKPTLTINSKDLRRLIRQTVFAISTVETRPILTGVHIQSEDEKIKLTATDSHRLATRTVKVKAEDGLINDVIIPGANLNELNKIFTDADQAIHATLLNNQLLFYTKDTFFLSRLLTGTYPDTSRLIPTDKQTTIHAFTKELIATIERADLLSHRDQNNVIRLDTLDENTLEISSNLPEVGNINEKLNVISIEGDQLKISFSSRYMLDALRTMDSERVQIDFTGTMRPFIITTPDDENILQLILPVRTF